MVAVAVFLGLSAGALASPYFLIESQQQWQDSLAPVDPNHGLITPVDPARWQDYMMQWETFLEEGDPYPPHEFIVAELYVYGGGGDPNYPEDAGLVMVWRAEAGPGPGEYSSAWLYDYQLDPDLSNSTITVTVTAPQFDFNGNQINVVSFGIQDVTGAIRAWYWNVGPLSAPIQWNVPTTITINTSLTGVGATSPQASSYMNNPAFNLTQSQFFIVDENATWVGGPTPIPPPGQVQPGMWNYWHNLMVTPHIPPKGDDPVKWSQPPEVYQPSDPPVFYGWDEYSEYTWGPIVADDWVCTDQLPVTDIHWWGSFIGWDQPYPPQLPVAFHIAIWTDVPAGVDQPFSHPGLLLWQTYCNNYTWNFAGYDRDPRMSQPEPFTEACFQFNQYLDPDQWFCQEPDPTGEGRIYWLSIAAIYQEDPQFPWGWKTRKRDPSPGIRLSS